MKKYDPKSIEKKWQKTWDASKIYEARDSVADKPNYLALVEFPYPSGNLHIGHWYSFAVPDILARYQRMMGKNVMYPIGFDAFGLPAENAAIKRNLQPKDWTESNIKHMTKQLKSMGASFDWSREVQTIDPAYYKWTQWIFLQFYKKGLAYRAKTLVNWCPNDKTVLANEQVMQKDGKNVCDRCGSEVEQKELAQWMIRITDYADRLVDDLDNLDWPETTKLAQKNWIGRSEGAEIDFKIKGQSDLAIKVFTTRADTLFGVTYVVISPEHALLNDLAGSAVVNADEIGEYIKQAKAKTERERLIDAKDKTGVELKGIKAINPIDGTEVPVWVADYVLGSYGTGAVMAVPAHDDRDFEFAQKYALPNRVVIEDGRLIKSAEFDGLTSAEAREKIIEKLSQMGAGQAKKNYRLRDWVVSRQRYWGVPIPMIVCEKCGYQPVPESDLPVVLPKLDNYLPADDGRSPLARAEKWLKVTCPQCGGTAERETDTMDTFVDSSWYFLRYTDPHNADQLADPAKIKQWLPANIYIGGAEHNTMHLLYARFFTKALHDMDVIDFDEAFLVRRNHGMVLGPDGQKMSKSKGNVIDPDELVEQYGADTIRMYLAFMTPYDQGGAWDPKGINGIVRFLNRVWQLQVNVVETTAHAESAGYSDLQIGLQKAIKKIGEDIAILHFNTGVSELMKLLNQIEAYVEVTHEIDTKIYKTFLQLLAPFAPHVTEEIWYNLDEKATSIHLESWPAYTEVKASIAHIAVQVNGKMRGMIDTHIDATEAEVHELALKTDKIKQHLEGQAIEKTIFVKNKLISFVI